MGKKLKNEKCFNIDLQIKKIKPLSSRVFRLQQHVYTKILKTKPF